MTTGDEYEKLEAQADEVQRTHVKAAQDRLLARAKAVGLSTTGISKIVHTHMNVTKGYQALLEETERREKLHQR